MEEAGTSRSHEEVERFMISMTCQSMMLFLNFWTVSGPLMSVLP